MSTPLDSLVTVGTRSQEAATAAMRSWTEGAQALAGAQSAMADVPDLYASYLDAVRKVLARYLPTQLSDDELATIARTAVEETAAELGQQPGPRQMGQVMKRANAAAAGRADGGRVAAAVKALLLP